MTLKLKATTADTTRKDILEPRDKGEMAQEERQGEEKAKESRKG